MILVHRPHLGELSSGNIREHLELYLLLAELVNSYGLALGTVADVLGHPSRSEIVDGIHRSTAQLASVFPEAFRPFMEEGREGGASSSLAAPMTVESVGSLCSSYITA